jgi:hypothetical protein
MKTLVRKSGSPQIVSATSSQPYGEFRIKDEDDILCLANTGEPALWWALLLPLRALLMFLLWGTRSPDRAVWAGAAVLAAAGVIALAWSVS